MAIPIQISSKKYGTNFLLKTPEAVKVFMWGRYVDQYEFRVGDGEWQSFRSNDCGEIKRQVQEAIDIGEAD